MAIPIIDLFAGPGGLGEGFASLTGKDGLPAFDLRLSIEKDPVAHRTLRLRAAYRLLRSTPGEHHYYDYVRGDITADEFLRIPAVKAAMDEAAEEARCHELGRTPEQVVDREILRALGGRTDWVLIGGPPCQAYSLAGRARRTNDASFADDVKHFLYREYLRIIRAHHPAMFVMENVKGLLSSTHSGNPMFTRILDDLSVPHEGVEYEIKSFVKFDDGLGLAPADYLIESERFGLPQARHRVILLGIRRSLGARQARLLSPSPPITVVEAIGDLPPMRSRLSRTSDSKEAWNAAILQASSLVRGWSAGGVRRITSIMRAASDTAASLDSTGARFVRNASSNPRGNISPQAQTFRDWVMRPLVGGVLQHEARAHMANDLARYLFAASFASEFGYSPGLANYPPALLPKHRNAVTSDGSSPPFNDRFRVQCAHQPSSTVVSHIAKDGHYYIHYDPSQCRSLTVREAARLQTFPDDYFFEGTRTQQYTQVGNAVPPLLARGIAELVRDLLQSSSNQGISSKLVAGAAA
ncbi:DNA cytosine methyltransferase [Thiomonas sp. FB-Cd]|uniref:DNA cytosine methyltransferase n=1 Tax=Thiomonas sp. FB-Cd TaxID=1158292 RepID=UPI0006901117|nr:DNA cytosine methyltransferase [Thiomonas sp. FB-Cd]